MPSRVCLTSGGGDLPELQEQLLRHRLVREISAAGVDAVVVVVPYGEVGNGLAQLVIARDALRHRVGALEVARILRVEIAVDIVAGEDEKLGLTGENGVPDRLWLDLVGAGAEGDARERCTALSTRGDRRQGGRGPQVGEGAALGHGGHQNSRISGVVGRIVKQHLKYALELAVVPLGAPVVFIEDVLLHYLGLAMARLAQWPSVAGPEGWLPRLPQGVALLAFW